MPELRKSAAGELTEPAPPPPLGVPSAAASEPPASGSSVRGSLAELAAALERLVPLIADGSSCAEARQTLREPIFAAFLGYSGLQEGGAAARAAPAPARGALLGTIPEARRAKAAVEVGEMMRSLRAVEAACGAGARAAELEGAGEQLEAARDRFREVIALYYGESCVGSPCNGRNGLPVAER